MSNYEVQDIRFCFNTAEIGGVSELRGYKLSGVNAMLFQWTEFEAWKNRLIMRGAVLTGVELSGDDSIFLSTRKLGVDTTGRGSLSYCEGHFKLKSTYKISGVNLF